MNTTVETNSKINFFGDMIGSPVFILISGKAGVGKTTSANFMDQIIKEESITKSIRIVGFAKGVKYTATEMGWDGEKDLKGRKLLQDIGKAGREYDKDLWVKYLINMIETGVVYPDIILVDDWRFPNEYEFIKNITYYTVVTIKIVAPEREILKGTEYYNDISETSLDNFDGFDYIVDNGGSKEMLETILTGIVKDLFRKESK